MQQPRDLRPRPFRTGRRLVSLLLGSGSVLLLNLPLRAQDGASFNALRALNLARNTAVTLNGGLSVYRPAACMFTTPDAENPCLVERSAEGFLFRFLGGTPGWQVLNLPPTRETEILIAPDGRSVSRTAYNGAPR